MLRSRGWDRLPRYAVSRVESGGGDPLEKGGMDETAQRRDGCGPCGAPFVCGWMLLDLTILANSFANLLRTGIRDNHLVRSGQFTEAKRRNKGGGGGNVG